MPSSPVHRPKVAHETNHRIRFRWNRLLEPALEPDYLEAWLSNLPGVDRVRVNPPGQSIIIEYDGKPQHRQTLLEGFDHIPDKAFDNTLPARPKRRLIDVLFQGHLAAISPFLPSSAQAVIASALGAPHILSGLDTLINDGLKAPVLDMTTIGASLLRADFTTASAIAIMVLVGEYLRAMTDDRSNELLKGLIAAPVDKVWVERSGRESGISFDKVRVGDVVLCNSGDLVPVDGEILEGKALVDCRSITGESTPVMVCPGDEIISGSVVVEGKIKASAIRTGSETSMARIAEFMTNALNEKSHAEVKSDRLADALTPITLGLGAAIYAATGDMERALSVLTIDFACAVKFPAPVVVKTSMHTAARQGVLIKSGKAIEMLASVDAIVFDKTGTLTEGKLSVTDIVLNAAITENEFLALAGAVEDRHGHPIGRSIIQETANRGLTPYQASDIDLSIAHGVSGTVQGSLIRLGSRHFINDDCGIDCSVMSRKAKALRAQGKSLVYASQNGKLLGMAAMRDTIRPEAPKVVAALREHGVKKIVILTGDHQKTAESFVQKFPYADEIRAELTPEGKTVVVNQLKAEGYTVAVVGDGVNDAPAFTAADVGICMSQSTGLARKSAQIVLTHDSLEGLVTVRRIAMRVDRILQNCFNAGVGVNVGLLGIAVTGFLRPATAAAIHNLNTFAILGTAAWASSREIPPRNKKKVGKPSCRPHQKQEA